MNRIYTQCNQEKSSNEFYLRGDSYGYRSECKDCVRLTKRENNKKYRWKGIWYNINTRCNNPKCKDYKNYGGRGIKNLLTKEDIKYLMIRDNYWNLKRPSIDRKDNDGNYELSNCRFIELSQNIARRNIQHSSKIILQFDLQGNFIKEWSSITKASINFNRDASSISKCLRNLSPTSAGFIWKYKEN